MAKDYLEVTFLDAFFYFYTGSFESFHKTNDHIRYINVTFNHPPLIIQGLVKNIFTRISVIR